MYVRGECGKVGWVQSGGVAPLSWWFLVGLVLASASSRIYRLLMYVKSNIGKKMMSISSNNTSYIISILLMCPAGSAMMDELVKKFTVSSTYSELPSLPPKLAANGMLLSGLAGIMGDAA